MFGKFGWWNAASEANLTLAYANNSLNGNGLQDNRLLGLDYAGAYTKPDNTHNRSAFINLGGRHALNPKVLLTGNIYYRDIRTHTVNGDVNEGSLDQSVYQPNDAERNALADAGYTGFPTGGADADNTPFPFWRCLANVLLIDEPGEKCNGLINRGQSDQHNFGLSGQTTVFGTTGSHRNQLTVGGAYDRSRVGFRQSTQLGYLNPDRSVTGLPAFADGATGGDVDGEPFDTRVDLDGVIQTWSLYGTDTFTIANRWHLTASARYNRTTVRNSDAITPGGGAGSLDGRHTFARLNPAVGLTFNPSEHANVYVGYSEGSRAATSIELGCADPAEPCKLPNAMAGDPPLRQVTTRTLESGIRSGSKEAIHWNASYFFAQNNNDILFVTSTASGFGYFRNFGATRRQGLEVDLNASILGKITLGGGYTLLDATFQSPEEVNGTGNSSNDEGSGFEGAIDIEPGDRLPLTPRHMLKSFISYRPIRKVSLDVDLVAMSSSLARGNENDAHQPDGTFYLGAGKAAGYGVVNAGARYAVHSKLEIVLRLSNAFDKRYSTAAQLGSTAFTADGNFVARPFPAVGGEFPIPGATFLAPGAPRMLLVSTRVKF
jgi:outer membrane receptor protein involved in Fe transport